MPGEFRARAVGLHRAAGRRTRGCLRGDPVPAARPGAAATSGPFGISQHVADADAVLDAAGAGRAYLIGHSWGGHLAMHLAVRHLGRVLGLVIVDPLGAVPDDGLGDMEQNLTERIRTQANRRR